MCLQCISQLVEELITGTKVSKSYVKIHLGPWIKGKLSSQAPFTSLKSTIAKIMCEICAKSTIKADLSKWNFRNLHRLKLLEILHSDNNPSMWIKT